jgi:hypothetical protein
MPITEEQRQAIRSLLDDRLSTDEIATRLGLRPAQVRAIKAHVTIGSYSNDGTPTLGAESELVEAFEAKFGLERDPQMALCRNIGQLLPGAKIIDGGKEQTVASGRIDITARDEAGATVVIELKAGESDRDAIGQILSYIGDLMEQEDHVRGTIVAQGFTSRAVSAARSVPSVRLVSYGFQFTFESVTGKA